MRCLFIFIDKFIQSVPIKFTIQALPGHELMPVANARLVFEVRLLHDQRERFPGLHRGNHQGFEYQCVLHSI